MAALLQSKAKLEEAEWEEEKQPQRAALIEGFRGLDLHLGPFHSTATSQRFAATILPRFPGIPV